MSGEKPKPAPKLETSKYFVDSDDEVEPQKPPAKQGVFRNYLGDENNMVDARALVNLESQL